MHSEILITIIIPVYNDSEGLRKCLEAISVQRKYIQQSEVIVVDNASDISPENIVGAFSFAQYIYEKKAGSYAARNKGMTIARGKYIIFLDADCTPTPDWLEKGIQCLEDHPHKTLIGGEVSFTLSDNPTSTELYQYIVGFQQQENIELKNFSATANLFVKREDAIAIGAFEEELLSGGDRSWSWRAKKLGHEIIFCSAAIVKTHPRQQLKKAIVQTRRVAGGRFHIKKLGITNKMSNHQDLESHRTLGQAALWILRHPELSHTQRLRVLWVASILKVVALLENWRLSSGFVAERS